MSLINQMLQDLDARGSQGAGTSAMQAQVRAVPVRRDAPVALWVMLTVLLTLVGLVAWLLWRHPLSPERQDTQATALVLKFAPELSMVPLPAAEDGVMQNKRIIAPSSDSPSADSDRAKTPVIHERQQALIQDSGKTGQVATPGAAENTMAPMPRAEKPSVEVAPITTNIAKQIKELTPQQNAENAYRRATTLTQQGKTAEAIGALEQALQLDPSHAAARQTLAGLLVESRRPDDAIRRLKEGLNLDPNSPGSAMILARLQVDKGDLKPAIDTLQRGLPYATDRAEYLAFLAALLQRDGRHKEAIDQYNAALRKQPQNGIWWMGIGLSLHAENRGPESIDAFNRAKASASLSAELRSFVEEKLNQWQH